MASSLIWSLLPLLPLGLVAGLLSGLLGIGGGLIFSPLLLLLGLTPHQALATSTLAIVPTTLGGTVAHVRSGRLTWPGGVAIAGGAALSAGLFSHLGQGLAGWQLLSLQAALYALLTGLVKPRSQLAPVRERQPHPPALVGALAGVPPSRLEQVREERLVWMLWAITLVLALDSGRRAMGLWFEAQGITLQKPGSSS
jgi:uncharacterized protein